MLVGALDYAACVIGKVLSNAGTSVCSTMLGVLLVRCF